MAVTEVSGDPWLASYHHLLARHELKRHDALNGALAQSSDQPGELFSLAQILAKPALLEEQVLRDYPDAEHPRLRKARISVLHQSLALQVIAPRVIELFRDGVSAPLNPDRIFLCSLESSDAPSRWRHLSDDRAPLAPGAFIDTTTDQVRAWYPVFRQHFGVSPGAYWSSVGLALSAPFSAVWNQVDPDALCALATSWLARFECDANRYIDWIPAEFSQQRCALPQRRGCCLKYLLPGGGYCGTCGIYRRDRIGSVRESTSDTPRPAT